LSLARRASGSSAAGRRGRSGRPALAAAQRVHHHLPHPHARGQPGAHAGQPAFVLGRQRHRLGHLELGVFAQVADHAHRDARVDGLLQLFGQRDVLDREVVEGEAVALEGGRHRRAHLVGQQELVGGHVEEGHVGTAEGGAHGGDHQVAQLLLQLVDGVAGAGAADLGEELRGSASLYEYMPKARSRTMPKSLSRIVTGCGVPHLRPSCRRVLKKYTSDLKGDSKSLSQFFRLVSTGMVWVVSVHARPEHVGHLAFVDEHRHLRLAHREAGAVLDLEVFHRVAPGQRAVGILVPLEDVDELLLDEGPETHAAPDD
jgi:hypothetical protein